MIQQLISVINNGGGSSGGSGGLITTQIVSGFTDTDRYYTADGTGPSMNLTGFSYWVVDSPVRNQGINNIQFVFGKSDYTNNRGWGFRIFQGCIRPVLDQDNIGTATITQKQAQGTNVHWDEVGKLRVIHTVIRNNVVYTYKNGALLGYGGIQPPGLSKTTIQFPQAAQGIGIGAFPGASASPTKFYEGGIVACGIASSTGLTDQQVFDHYNLILNNPYAQPVGATHLWRASDAGATWTDSISGLIATRIGNPVRSVVTLPFYPKYDVHEPYVDTPILPKLIGQIKIMSIGDSRTSSEGSWRLYVQNNMASIGMDVKWVGIYPDINNPDYTNGYGWKEKSNGMPGQSAPAVLNGFGGFPPFAQEVATRDPDVIVMWFGQNATDSQAGERQEVIDIINQAWAYNPNIRIVVASEICSARQDAIAGGAQQAKFDGYDLWKKNLVLSLKAQGKKITYAKLTESVRWDDSADWADNIHPASVPYATPTSLMGQNRVGEAMWPAIKVICGFS